MAVLGHDLDRAREQAVLHGERVLVRACVVDGDKHALPAFGIELGQDHRARRTGIDIVRIAGRAGQPGLGEILVVLDVHRRDGPLLLNGPRVRKVVHKGAVDDVPLLGFDFFAVYLFGVDNLVDRDLRRRDDVAAPFADEVWMRDAALVGLALEKFENFLEQLVYGI